MAEMSVDLKYPIAIEGGTLASLSLSLSRPGVMDRLLSLRLSPTKPMRSSDWITTIAEVTGLPRAVVAKLNRADLSAAAEIISGMTSPSIDEGTVH
jgi:hypothetical protein